MLVVLNLIILETLLSIDNAAVLATMVQVLPKEQRQRALTYGIRGAYIMRGLCLIFASILIKVLRLKLIGGLYLIYLAYKFFTSVEGGHNNTKGDTIFTKYFGLFRGTVAAIELSDLAFSLDNVFAAVALSSNMVYVVIGCFIGIAAIRFASGIFVKAVEKYPELESIAFGVIGVLGLKLVLSYIAAYVPALSFINSHTADSLTSVATIIAFLYPVVISYVRNYKKNT